MRIGVEYDTNTNPWYKFRQESSPSFSLIKETVWHTVRLVDAITQELGLEWLITLFGWKLYKILKLKFSDRIARHNLEIEFGREKTYRKNSVVQ